MCGKDVLFDASIRGPKPDLKGFLRLTVHPDGEIVPVVQHL